MQRTGSRRNEWTFWVSSRVSISWVTVPFVSTALSSIFAVCNAGVGLVGPLEVQSLDSMRQILEVNLFGTIQTIQAFLPEMKAQGKGHILVTGSTGGLHGETSKCLRDPCMPAAFHTCSFGHVDACCPACNCQNNPSLYIMLTGLPFNEVYCASKFAIEGACESLAVLLQHFSIQWVSWILFL